MKRFIESFAVSMKRISLGCYCVSSRRLKGQSKAGWTSLEMVHLDTKNRQRNWGFQMVVLTGWSHPMKTALYYKAADFYFSFNEWDARFGPYLESIASGTWLLLMAILTPNMHWWPHAWKAYEESDSPAILFKGLMMPAIDETAGGGRYFCSNLGRRVH